MALSDFTGPDFIDAWTKDLDRRWPERAAMADCVVRTLVGWRGEWREQEHHQAKSPRSDHHATIRLLELGVGAGGLACTVLDTLTDQTGARPSWTIEYTGIDIEQVLFQHVDEMLVSAGHQNVQLVCTNLKEDTWPRGLGPFDAVFTLQTLHDLGGIGALEAIYRQAHGLLATGGLLVNADFVVPFEKDDPERPRRLPVETHENLLSSLGFVDFRCELQRGKMACMSVQRP
ncbi:MAG: class I SAM-dependent methyltransferase [Gemmatimonadetes bacterium]|nr:class I SAM-dependent methyltransferase [Gemmatimonadota bacterium]MYD24374.1 class I SAM-dependent methyltransferase [Gemmatimonadota bacterium]MYJ00668.1 class I SAM-dependent methyltransferase [Gemmatimonadota bacterium]